MGRWLPQPGSHTKSNACKTNRCKAPAGCPVPAPRKKTRICTLAVGAGLPTMGCAAAPAILPQMSKSQAGPKLRAPSNVNGFSAKRRLLLCRLELESTQARMYYACKNSTLKNANHLPYRATSMATYSRDPAVLDRVEELCRNCNLGKYRHFNASSRAKRLNDYLGLPVVAINIILGSVFFIALSQDLPSITKWAGGFLGFVRKVVVAKIAAMTGWRPVWQGVTNFLMRHGS